EKSFHIKPGEVTPDNKLGVQVARCIGACGLAPAVVVDDEVMAKVSASDIEGKITAKTGVHS
ncbi:MAG: NAD(P)H-dependent oxidoreductase subunit E, partial [Candidatus Omnitrophica bacterium]|nr:NAD(P)H-dependent oxidoreductase subunit E [Candidatus Omnitrophota bacterium]